MDTKVVFKRISLRFMETGKESAINPLIKCVRENFAGTEDETTLVDMICTEVIHAKPQKPNEFIDSISSDSLKVSYRFDLEEVKLGFSCLFSIVIYSSIC